MTDSTFKHRESMIPKKQLITRESGFKSKLVKPRTSTASTKSHLKSTIPLNTIENTQPGKVSIFKVVPTKKNLTCFPLPEELKGRPRIIGNESQLEALYQHTKKVAKHYFSTSSYNVLFPSYFNPKSVSRLSYLSGSSRNSSISMGSRIPILRKSSIAPDSDLMTNDPSPDELSMANAFKFLSRTIAEQKAKAINIVDFYLLYISLVLSISNQEGVNLAIHFLSEFLDLKATRPQEVNILFSVLLRICENAKEYREIVIECLSKLANLETSLAERLENGSTHRDVELSSLCKDVLNKIGKNSILKQEKFVSISDSVNEDVAIIQLGKYIEILEDNGQPSDIIDFIKNIVAAMMKYHKSANVLELSAACIESVISFCEEPPVEIMFQCLSLCFSILSGEMFLTGEKSFEAVETIQKLTTTIFDCVSPKVLIASLTSVISEAKDAKFNLVLQNLYTYVNSPPENFDMSLLDQVSESLEIFHPEENLEMFGFLQKKLNLSDNIDVYEMSIERLNNPDTLFDEVDAIVSASPNGKFDSYPNYVQTLLQMAWLISHDINDGNKDYFDQDILEIVLTTKEKIKLIKNDDIDGSEFGLDNLQREIESMINSGASIENSI